MTDQHDTSQTGEQHGGWTGGQEAIGDFAPAMAHYTDKVLFDEVWEREGLSKRDRSLITVAALTALGKTDQLRFHLGFARTNGVTTAELTEAITHLAFYAGWPNGMGAMSVAKQVLTA
jgi:4-carboxymuconolactone decarboxylase